MRVSVLAAGWPPSVDLSDGPRHTVRTSAGPKCLEEKVIYVLGWSRRRESPDTTYQRSWPIHQLKAISSDGSIISSCRRSDPKVENWRGQALFSKDEWRPSLVSFPLKRDESCGCCLLLPTGRFKRRLQDDYVFLHEAWVFLHRSLFETIKLRKIIKKQFSHCTKARGRLSQSGLLTSELHGTDNECCSTL